MTVPITLIGNTTADPELAFTPSGDARASFTLAVNERIKKGDEWVDGDATFYRVTAWKTTAEAIAETVTKGTRLIIQGKFKPREYETKTGEKRMSLDVTADVVGVVVRAPRAPQRTQEREPDPWTSGDPAPF